MRLLHAWYRTWQLGQSQFRLANGFYQLGMGGARAVMLLDEIADSAPDSESATWLLSFRDHIREIQRLKPTAALTYLIEHTESPQLRRLDIWLLGRCGGKLGTHYVAQYANAPDRSLRKEVARCLKRLKAYTILQPMADHDPDPRIRRMAQLPKRKPYTQRMGTFCRNVARQSVTPGKQELVISSGTDFQHGRPAKSTWWIRTILERIRRLVRGTAH